MSAMYSRLFLSLMLLLASGLVVSGAAPAAASNLRAVTNSPFTFSLSWRDNSNNETSFIVGARPAGSAVIFTQLGDAVPANVTNFVAAGLMVPGTTNEIAVFAANGDGVTGSSGTVIVQMPRFDAPTNLQAAMLDASTVRLTWKDNTTNETDFFVGVRIGTSGSFTIFPGGVLPANTTNFTAAGLEPAQTYQFVIQANYLDAFATNEVLSSVVTVNTPNAFTSRRFHPAVVGESIEPYTLAASTDRETPNSFGVAGLPPGLSFDGTDQITGTPTQAGIFQASLTAQYPTEGTITNALTFRVIHPTGPPAISAVIPKQTLTKAGPPVILSLNSFFRDLDAEKAVRFATTKGNFDLALYPSATPQTVSNFLGYVTRGDYSNTLIYRASRVGFFSDPFVIQGGSLKAAGTNFTRIPFTASPTNEPGVKHLRGTVSLAKKGGLPNSAVADWFINLRDNSDQLDDQNGGFAAFGRVCGNGLDVADSIMTLPVADYTVLVDGTPSSFDDWPSDAPTAPPAPQPASHIVVQSVGLIEPLTYAVTGDTVPGLVSAVVNGTNLVLTPLSQFGGITTLTVAATDLDGNTNVQSFVVEIASAYTTWLNQFALAGGNSLPTADPDGDGVTNAVEFALAGSPTVPDAAASRPRHSLTNISSQPYLAVNFKLAKDLSGASVLINAANQVTGGWTNLWSSSNLASPLVTRLVDQGSNYLITVRDTAPVTTGASNRFLNLRVQLP
jgi:cyclophilin family peptidyl-prolyl cis-trans isomerase